MKNAPLVLLMILGAVPIGAAEPAGDAPATQPAAGAAAPSSSQPRFTLPVRTYVPTVDPSDITPSDREALIYIGITISTEGNVTNATILEDRGFGDKIFRNLSLAAAKGMRFRPATLDGKAIVTTVTVPFAFMCGISKDGESEWITGVSPEFRSEMNKVGKLLEKKDFAGAHEHVEWMLREKVKFAYEYALLQAQLAQTLALNGRDLEALDAAVKASRPTTPNFQKFALHQPIPPNSPSNYLLPQDLIVPLLEMRMQLAADNGRLVFALQSYNELAGLVKMAPGDLRAVGAARITAKLESNAPLTVKGRIEIKEWKWELFRRNFTLNSVQGKIESMNLLCGDGHQELRYAPGESWSVPAGWMDCTLGVIGDAGTTFNLVEVAN